MNANIFERANQIVKSCDAAYVGLFTEDGYPTVSTVSNIDSNNILEIYFSTGIGSNKVQRLRKNNRASICYRSGSDNITLVGEAELLTDQETKSRMWQSWFIEHYPEGETDPNYCIIKFTSKRVSLWVGYEWAEFTADEFMKVQSYCGLLCDGCSYKESHGCRGCIELKGNPFWGQCDVAKCCIAKGYAHCGECPDLPCEDLKGMSCGDDEHCDKPPGARIEVCKAWAGSK